MDDGVEERGKWSNGLRLRHEYGLLDGISWYVYGLKGGGLTMLGSHTESPVSHLPKYELCQFWLDFKLCK